MDRLQDRISRGLGAAARALGSTTDAYRPSGVADPLAPKNRYLRLHTAFSATDGKFLGQTRTVPPYGRASLISAYTRPGDYLVQHSGTWFVAAQQRLLPALCVKANRVVSFARAAAPTTNGLNAYGGVTLATATPLLTNWPASVLGVAGSGRPEAASRPTGVSRIGRSCCLPFPACFSARPI